MSDEAQSTKAVEIVNSLPPVQADYEAQFNKAAEIVNSFPKDGPVQADYNTKLDMYKYYKQATIGNVNISRPGFFDFEGGYKWDRWKSVEGTSKEVCYKKYVQLLVKLLKDSEHPDAKQHLDKLEALGPLDPEPETELSGTA